MRAPLSGAAAKPNGNGGRPSRRADTGLVLILGVTQWIAWGSTYYLMTVIAQPIVAATRWPLGTVVAGLSVGLVIAGLVSPAVGRIIEGHGGRPVLASGSVILALGLIGLGLAKNYLVYFGAWSVLGIGMGASLYDAAFAALGWLYGQHARRMIGNLTLIGGLVMTVTWPLSAFLTGALGWRGTCFVYAAIHLAIGLPLLLTAVPSVPLAGALPPPAGDAATRLMSDARGPRAKRGLLWLLGTNLTLQIGIGSVLAVHLLGLLQGLHLTLTAAVSLGSLMGACQVGGRLIEISFARHVHPVWEGIAASMLVFLGFALLLTGRPAIIAAALVVYGLGNGVRTIVKGTLPLVLFGAEGYATLIGRLGMPTLIAQAAGPALGALTLARFGTMPTLVMLAALAFVNLILSWFLRLSLSDARVGAAEAPSSAGR